jgi:hypothetical protein
MPYSTRSEESVVSRISYGPGESLVMLEHPDAFADDEKEEDD